MLKLALFRHAKAANPGPGQRDFDRPLTGRGRTEAASMGRMLDEGFDLALVSPALRTRETWEIASRESHPEVGIETDPALYLCAKDEIIGRLRKLPPSIAGVVVVGHNPSIHELALWLSAGDQQPGAAAMRLKFPPAGLAVFEIAPPWDSLKASQAKLLRFVTAKDAVLSR